MPTEVGDEKEEFPRIPGQDDLGARQRFLGASTMEAEDELGQVIPSHNMRSQSQINAEAVRSANAAADIARQLGIGGQQRMLKPQRARTTDILDMGRKNRQLTSRTLNDIDILRNQSRSLGSLPTSSAPEALSQSMLMDQQNKAIKSYLPSIDAQTGTLQFEQSFMGPGTQQRHLQSQEQFLAKRTAPRTSRRRGRADSSDISPLKFPQLPTPPTIHDPSKRGERPSAKRRQVEAGSRESESQRHAGLKHVPRQLRSAGYGTKAIGGVPSGVDRLVNLQNVDPTLAKQMMDQASGLQALQAQTQLSRYDGPKHVPQYDERVAETHAQSERIYDRARVIMPEPKLLDWSQWKQEYFRINGAANALRALISQNRGEQKPVYRDFIDSSGVKNIDASVGIDPNDPTKFTVSYRGKDSSGSERRFTKGGVDFSELTYGTTATTWDEPPSWQPSIAPEKDPNAFFTVTSASRDLYDPSTQAYQLNRQVRRLSDRRQRFLMTRPHQTPSDQVRVASDGSLIHTDLHDMRAAQLQDTQA